MNAVVLRKDADSDLSAFGGGEVYDLLMDGWNGEAYLTFQLIPISELAEMRQHFIRCANSENIDLEVLFYDGSCIRRGQITCEKSRWSLGWDDGNRIVVHVFGQEFFSHPKAEEALALKLEREPN